MGIEEVSILRTDITESNFDAFVAEHAITAILLHEPGDFTDDELDALARVCERTAMPSALGFVNKRLAPGVAAMFGVLQTPYLLIFRDQVALFAEPVRPTPTGLETVLVQIQRLDMDKVRSDIESEREAQASLLMRRACPTRYSGPALSRDD